MATADIEIKIGEIIFIDQSLLPLFLPCIDVFKTGHIRYTSSFPAGAYILPDDYRIVVLCDKAAYAKNCENINIPMMHCNGKCQVMKKIREQEKKESNLPERKWKGNEVLSSDLNCRIAPAYFNLLSIAYFSANSHSPLPCWHLSIFHPPQV